jgi:hypothetical protein
LNQNQNINIFPVGESSKLSSTIRSIKRPETRDKRTSFSALLFNSLKFIYDLTWRKIYWPDMACLWYLPAFKKAQKLLKIKSYDALITVSLPFTDHLVGYRIKKAYPDLFWIVDIGDPFSWMKTTPVNNSGIYSKINLKAEKAILNLSNVVSVTNKNTSRLYADFLGLSETKIKIIPPVVHFRLKEKMETGSENKSRGKFILSYFGVLYSEIRNPDGLLLAIDQVIKFDKEIQNKIEIHFWGEYHSCLKSFQKYPQLEKYLFFHHTVSKDEAIKAMCNSSILVNIGNVTDYQLPSKVIEYIALKRPILHFYSIGSDSSLDILRKYPFSFCCNPWNELDIMALTSFIKSSNSVSISEETIVNLIEEYTPEKIALKYLELIPSNIDEKK